MSDNPTQPAAGTVATAPPKTFRELVATDAYKAQIGAALPKHITPDRMVRTVLTAMNRNPKLLDCTKESLWQAVMDCASLGLEPDALGRAYLIPYEDRRNNRTICQLQIGFKGLADLAYRSGMVATIQAQVVRSNDHFVFGFGTDEKLEHKPLMTGDRGAPVCVYAYCKLKDGAFKFDLMSVDDVNRIRDRSQGYKSAQKYGKDHPWTTDWDEMAKKTVFKRLAKMLPLSSEIRDAVERDNAHQEIDLSEVAAAKPDRLADEFAAPVTVDTTAETVKDGGK
jgi:recombination protein RecT